MTMQAEIDAVVQAFVEDLADMVRRTALAAVQSALDGEEALSSPPPQPRAKAPSAPAARAKPATKAPKAAVAAPKPPARSAAPKPSREAPMDVDAELDAEEEPKPAPVPAPPLRKRLDPQRRGRVIVVPSTPPAALTTEEALRPAQVKQEIESSAASSAEARVEVPEVTPAKKWVIMRRPARDRSAGASEPPPPPAQKPSEPAPAAATAEEPPQPTTSAPVESAPVIERVTELEPLQSQDDEIAAG